MYFSQIASRNQEELKRKATLYDNDTKNLRSDLFER